MADRLFASDHGLVRFRFALRAVLSVALAALVQIVLGIPATSLLLGCVAALNCSTSMRAGTLGQRAVNIALFAPAMAASLTVATLLAPYRIVGDVVFVAVMFVAVYARKFDQLGASLGLGAFMAYFFASYLHATPALLPVMYGSVVLGVTCCAVVALGVFRDTPASTLRRTTASIRAQASRLIDQLADLLEDGEPPSEDGEDLPRAVARQARRMHETTLQIEDNADVLGLDPRWQRQLVDTELSADRLARATVRALAADLDPKTRADLAADLRGLHRFLHRDPDAAFTVDTDELVARIGRYDIRGDPLLLPSSREHHVLLVRRAIRELLLSVVQIRRTTRRILERLDAEERTTPDASSGTRESALQDADANPAADANAGECEGEPNPPGEHAPATPRGNGTAGTPAAATPDRRELSQPARAAIQAAIGGALAIVGGELLSVQRWYWAVIAGFIVFAGTTSRGDLLVKGWRRLWGTLLGIIAGTVLGTLLVGKLPVDVAVLLLCIFFAFYTMRVSYSTMTFFITVMLGMLYDVLGTFSPDVLLLRLEETAIGVAGSAVAAMLILPTRTRSTVLSALHEYFAALRRELEDARRLLIDADRVSVIGATREVDRAANAVRTAIDPMLHRLSPSRVRRGQATRLLTLTEESSLAARNLARAAEPGALATSKEAAETMDRLIANVDALLAATEEPPRRAKLVSGPALLPRVDLRALARAGDASDCDRVRVLHLRRTLSWLDRLDKLLLGMAAPLDRGVSVPRDHDQRHQDDGARRDHLAQPDRPARSAPRPTRS